MATRLTLRFCRRLLAVLAAAAIWPGVAGVAIATETATEQAVRTAMLYNFLKFSEWPAMTEPKRLKICLQTGDPEQVAAMEALRERQIRGKPLTVEIFRQQTDCDVIYVESRQRWNSLSEKLRPAHTLTIGSYAGFSADGGMIEITWQQGSPRFDINLPAAKRAGLRFYPQLLQLAGKVVE